MVDVVARLRLFCRARPLIASLNRCCRFHPQLHQVLVQLQTGEKEQDFSLLPIQVSISVQLWRLPGCHEFLAALGENRAS